MSLIVYLDEVGNPTLNASDRDFPVFAIAVLICERDCYVNEIVPRVNRLKFDLVGHEGVILHSRDIRKAQGDFAFLTDPTKRQPFYDSINGIMSECDYKIISVAIRKDRHVSQYTYPVNPYDLSLLFALERLVSVLEGAHQTEVSIVAEKRGQREDRELHTAFQRIVSAGSAYVSGDRFRRIHFRLQFLPKSMNIVGTQLADLAAYPIARHVLDSTRPNPSFDIVRRKFCRALKIFP